MVKLDVSLLRYLNKDDFRALTAVEMGMRNHELVPRSLVYSISGINNGSISKILINLTQNKLLSYERGKRYDGYRLTYRGYDYLALNVLRARGVLSSIGHQIGVGKESDVYVASNDDGQQFAVKFHRLGRTCFRKVSEKRDYQKKGQSHKAASWIYLSRLAAIREFAFMKLFHEKQLPIPQPIDYNRHCIVMELIDGSILNQINKEHFANKQEIETLYESLMQMIMKMVNDFGVVHGDFNEFNLMLKNNTTHDFIMIDFPQAISVDHELAEEYFERDVHCIIDFFSKRFNFESELIPCFEKINKNDEPSVIQNLANALDDEDTLLEHIKRNETRPKTQETIQEEDTQTEEQFKVQQISNREDLLSKFLNSFPSNDLDNNELYYDKMNEKLIQEAQVKVIETQLTSINLTKIEETNQLVKDENQHTESTVPSEVENQWERGSVNSYAYSTASTFTPNQVKARLMREKKKRELREKTKFNPKNIKGDANALRRRKKDDLSLAKEDLDGFLYG